jgi:nitroreductase
MMSVREAVTTRRSVRGFLDKPVDPALLRDILQSAARAPSGGNLQPWRLYVLAGEPMARLKTLMARRVQEAPMGEPAEYDIYPRDMKEPYRTHRFRVGEAMYGHIGIPRENKMGRLLWFSRNYQWFGAPVGLLCYVDRQMGPPQWSDLGMYLQTVMLLARAAGLDTCAQECWSIFNQTIAGFLGDVPNEWMLFCGMAIGYRDPDEPANQLITERAPLEEFATFRGL